MKEDRPIKLILIAVNLCVALFNSSIWTRAIPCVWLAGVACFFWVFKDE